MPSSFNWLARWLGFAWIGVVIFAFYPPHGLPGMTARAAGYGVAALGLAGWLLLDCSRRLARHRARLLPVVLGMITVATSVAAITGAGASPMVIYGFLAVMMAAGDASLPAALAVTAAGILAIEVAGLAAGVRSYGVYIGFPVALASGLMVGRNRAAYRIQAEQAAALLAQRERMEQQRERLDAERRRADVLDERARIAREIHDVLAHSLGALSIQIQAARSVLTDRGDIAQASDLLTAAQRMTAEGLAETRRAIGALRGGTLPLAEELSKTTADYAQRYGIIVDVYVTGDPRPVPPDVTVALLRVAQEALVNAAKHAPGQPVTACLAYERTGITLTVRNPLTPNHVTPNPKASTSQPTHPTAIHTADTGYGLTSMRERLRLLTGTLDAGPRDAGTCDGDAVDAQWTVTAWAPLPAVPAEPDEPGPPETMLPETMST